MIYILTGVAKSGKSLIAKEIVKRNSIPSFSTDYIMMMLAKGNKNIGIDTEAGDRVVAKQLEPYIEGMLKTMIENGVNHLIEGVHFNHDFISRMMKEYPNDIKTLYLGFKDIDASVKGDELYKFQDSSDNKWFLNLNEKEFKVLINYLIDESRISYDLCREFSLDYIEVQDISIQLEEIINKLLN